MDYWLSNHHKGKLKRPPEKLNPRRNSPELSLPKALCEEMDLDGDGFLNYEELKVGLMSCQMPEEQTNDFSRF